MTSRVGTYPPSDMVPVSRALISVSDKSGLVDFARALAAQRVDHPDELADFFFEAVNGLQICGYGGTGHRVVPSS